MELTYTQCKSLVEKHGSYWRDMANEMGNQPAWITQPLDLFDIESVNKGGCASGAYMPAVTYYTAGQVMAEHGDDVLQFIEDSYGELPSVPDGMSWTGLAVFYLSTAVELWCSRFDH